MKKIILATCFLMFSNFNGAAQQPEENIPVIINKIPSDEKNKPPTDIADLIGLTGKTAPLFKTVNMQGESVDLEKLRGNIIVLNLWATFCEPCIQEMPKLDMVVEKYKNKNVVFLAPAVDAKETLTVFLKAHPFSYQVLPATFDIISRYSPEKKDGTTNKTDSFEMVLPTHLVINKDGIVVKHFWGFSKTIESEISGAIDELLIAKSQ